MQTIYLRRSTIGFVPNDEMAAAAVAEFKVGEVVKCDVRKPKDRRSAQQNRLYWKLMQVVYENSDYFTSAEQVSDFVKIQAGHCTTTMIVKDGEQVPWLQPLSIAFDKMGHAEFQEYWKRAIDIICTRIIPGMNKAELEAEIHELLGEAA